MIIAIATAASAAAIVIINMVKKIPSSLSGYRYLLNTTKFIFTLFNINSIDISIVIAIKAPAEVSSIETREQKQGNIENLKEKEIVEGL